MQSVEEPVISRSLLELLVCPRDGLPLQFNASVLSCSHDHEYPVYRGVPVLLLDDERQTLGVAGESLKQAWRHVRGEQPDDPWCVETLGLHQAEKEALRHQLSQPLAPVDPAVGFLVGATNGIMYRHLIGRLSSYPIPEIRLEATAGRRLLDIGCSWGRWCVAAGRKGYQPIGLDPSLGAVLAARRVCSQLGVRADFVVGDARFLPFSARSFENVFSYSVLQHFPKADAAKAFAEALRALTPGGEGMVQMPNWIGIRCLYHQARRGFRKPRGFEVRYWGLGELRRMVERTGARATLSVDCFFGLGLQASDIHFMSGLRAAIMHASERLRQLSAPVPLLTRVADSVYVRFEKSIDDADQSL